MRKIALLLLLLLIQGTVVWGSVENDYREAKAQYHELQRSRTKQKYRENWMAVIERFEEISRRGSAHGRGPDALYMAGKVTRGMYGVSRSEGDARKAAGFYEEIVKQFPADSLADDGLVLAADIYENILHEPSVAYRLYRRAMTEYPRGDQIRVARKKTEELAAHAPAADVTSNSSGIVLSEIRTWSGPGYTRIVLDLNGEASYVTNFLPGDRDKSISPRLYVDLLGVQPGEALTETIPVKDGLLQQIRSGRNSSDTFRVVLDLNSMEEYKVFTLKDPLRLVIDVRGNGGEAEAKPAVRQSGADPIGTILKEPVETTKLPTVLPPTPEKKGKLRIVVDAGHGGKDPGAVGRSGTYEKDVTLDMAKALARELERSFDCEVILTRDKDIFIPLRERTAIANRLEADLFISVHANASRNASAYGVETYYLNFSKNDKAAAVAARENGTSLKEVGDLELILFDLMANSKINESSRLAAQIQKSLISDLSRKYSHVKDLGVRQGPFYVLLGANMPSVLVETAFISHRREEQRLKDPGYHRRTAHAIASAIRDYATSQKMIAVR